MSRSQNLLTVLGFLAAAALTGFIVWFVGLEGGDESEARTLLANEGALVVMNPDGRHVGTVSLSTLQDQARLRDVLRIVAGLRNVKSLDLNRTAIDNSGLKTISIMTSLVSLSLKSTKIDDAGLTHIANLTRLESLHLNDTAVTDSGLGSLTTLSNLKILDLSGTHVKNDLSPLAKLANLEWLVLGDLSLGDSSLVALGDIPKLKRLTLRGSKYSESAMERLSAKRPGLRIDQ